jgi:hypothetical protein
METTRREVIAGAITDSVGLCAGGCLGVRV